MGRKYRRARPTPNMHAYLNPNYRRQGQVAPSFDQLAHQIHQEAVPPGYEHDPYCQYRAESLREAAYRGWLAGQHAAQSAPQAGHYAVEEARLAGYEEAVRDQQSIIMRAEANGYKRGYNAAQTNLQKACKAAYDDGFKAGCEEGPAGELPGPQRKAVVRDVVADAMEQCRVIAESNPQMAPGANACKRLIKKLM